MPRASEASPALSIIIPVFNQVEYTQRCLDSIIRHPPEVSFEVVIVDDASDDVTGEYLREINSAYPYIRNLRNDSNLGFARSCNRGAESARGEYLLFLNNDTEVTQGWFSPLFGTMKNNPDIGIIGPKLCFPDGSIQHCGKIWKDTDGPLSQPHHIYYGAPADAPCVNKSRDFRIITGACMMVRKNEFFSIGLFDEGFENGWEDDDLCYAYCHAGKRVFYCAESTVIHYESKSLNVDIERANRLLSIRRQENARNSSAAISMSADGRAAELALISNVEEKLLNVRARFTRNRDRFFAKWKGSIARDDFRYYKEDGIPFVSIIIPVFNQLDYTRKCLESLSRNTPDGSYELIIVDNCSSDGTPEFLNGLEIPARIISNNENMGFAHACNQGAEAAHGEFLLFLNNDTEPLAGWLDAMVEAARLHNAGVVGCKMLYPDNRIQHAGIGFINGLPDHVNRFANADAPEVNRLTEMDMVTGACLLVPRELFLGLAGFDEIYRNGVEDIDLCLRVREAGYPVIYHPQAVIYHHEGKSEGRFNNVKGNLDIFFRRWRQRFDQAGRFIVSGTPRHIKAECGMLSETEKTCIFWQGSQFVCHSLALVNRELCLQLIGRGHDLSLVPYEPDQFGPEADPRFIRLAERVNAKPSSEADVVIRHQWPPDFTPPTCGRWVMIQPWEFGSLPVEWIAPMRDLVDELWVPSSFVRDCYIASGIPAGHVHVVPNGVDTTQFNSQVQPLELKTSKKFRFLFVGGTIHRKGIDLLLTAYANAFTSADDVCLVIKDMGGGSFYRGQTAQEMIARFQRRPAAPEIEYMDNVLSPAELAGLYTACHCLVHPYRGEGFGLPIAEAMACGLAAIVTGYGAALDFCDADTGWLIPAQVSKLPAKRIGDIPTVDYPWLAEPDVNELGSIMINAACHPEEVSRRGKAAANRIASLFSWEKAVDVVEQRLAALVRKPVLRDLAKPHQPEKGLASIILRACPDRSAFRNCLESIRSHTVVPHEIIVTGSSRLNEIPGWLNDEISVLPNARATELQCNAAIRSARGEFICLMDGNLIVTAEWLDGMIDCLSATADSGIAGPVGSGCSGIQGLADGFRPDSSDPAAFAAEFRKHYRYRRIPNRQIEDFCMLFRRELVDKIGGLDESLDSEGSQYTDFCLRSALSGLQNVIAGDVYIHRAGGISSDIIESTTGNMKLFNEKWSRPVTDEAEAKKILRLKTLEKAEALYQCGEIENMIETLLQEGIKSIPGEPAFYHALAANFIDLGRHGDAIDTLRQIPGGLDDEKSCTLAGRALAGLGSFEEARLQAEKALRINDRSAAALNLMGIMAFDSGSVDEAADLFNKAIDADPGFGEACTNLGLMEPQKGNSDPAFDFLEKGFLLNPLSSHAALGYHSAVAGQVESRRAEDAFREAHRLHPRHRNIHFLLIDLLIRSGKAEEALEEIENACVAFGVDDGMVAAALELRRQFGPMKIQTAKKRPGTTVSLCMIMKDEERNLPRCLKSLKPIVDEMIIVDTGSRDRSRELAEIFGARVLERPWDGDFSAARNAALEHAEGNWILIMDADEVISPLDYRPFAGLLEGATSVGAAYDIVTRNYVTKINLENWRANDGRYPLEEAGAGWMPSNKVRLFPNRRGILFENPIHEMVDRSALKSGLSIVQAPVPVHHYGYLNEERQKRKGEEYYLLGKRKLEESGGNDFRALCELAVQAGGTGRYEEAVELWRRVLAINPEYPLAYFNLGFALLHLGRFTESRDASKRAIELQPGYCEAVNNYAICEICTGDLGGAIAAIEENLANRPDYPNALVMLALARICAGSKQDGLEIFGRLAARGIAFSEFINESVKRLTQAGKLDFARNVLDAAVESGNYDQCTVEIIKSLSEERSVA